MIEISDVDFRLVVEFDFRLSRPLGTGRNQRHARGYGLSQELDPFDDTPLPIIQGGIASMAADRRIGSDVVAGAVHQGTELWLLLAQSVGHDLPLGFGLGLDLLSEDRFQNCRHVRALLGRRMGQGVSHPVNAAPLVSRVEDPPRGSSQALVVIGDHQLHAAQAAVGEGAEEPGPERLRLGRTGGHTQHLPLAVPGGQSAIRRRGPIVGRRPKCGELRKSAEGVLRRKLCSDLVVQKDRDDRSAGI